MNSLSLEYGIFSDYTMEHVPGTRLISIPLHFHSMTPHLLQSASFFVNFLHYRCSVTVWLGDKKDGDYAMYAVTSDWYSIMVSEGRRLHPMSDAS